MSAHSSTKAGGADTEHGLQYSNDCLHTGTMQIDCDNFSGVIRWQINFTNHEAGFAEQAQTAMVYMQVIKIPLRSWSCFINA